MSPLINFYASICHQMAIMQPHKSPFQSQLSEKLKMYLWPTISYAFNSYVRDFFLPSP